MQIDLMNFEHWRPEKVLENIISTQKINLYKKDLLNDIEFKEIKAYWNNKCTENSINNHFKIFCD